MALDDNDENARLAPATPNRSNNLQRSSYETGESSRTGSLKDQTPSTDRSRSDRLNQDSSPAEGRTRRRNKNRSAGGFLLQDAVATDGVRRRARSQLQPKGKAVPRTPEKGSGSHGHSSGSHGPSSGAPSQGHSSASKESSRPSETTESSPADRASQDVDASQIVNMALNLSESRRIASRRHASRTNPPRLAPLPDASPRSNLGQHLQQQRKLSRTGSPRPGHGTSPRIPSGAQRANSPLQHDQEQYRYHFSASTLARAQKAKEHLELMSEYRRMLESLPPLKPGEETLGSPTAVSKKSRGNGGQLGRPYNPLQYVRNRKVRARERKVIDGEHMGFGDVDTVRSWVDRLQEWNSAGGQANHFTMPHFAGSEDQDTQTSPENVPKQATRARRPRVDWFFDPCDMMADAYWLEQENHKQLIENRHWHKIFPPVPGLTRPMSKQGDEPGLGVTPMTTNTDEGAIQDLGLVPTEEAEGKRERAKQKLHDMKGFHHRQASSVHSHHDFFGKRRDSLSDLSGSDNEAKNDTVRRRRDGRRGTITSDTNELLEKQMMDIVAQETRDKELANVPETEAEHFHHPEPTPPERVLPTSQPHSRKTSVADFSDPEPRASRHRVESPPRYRRGRPSLEIPEYPRRGSVTEFYQSMPSSPRFDEHKELGSPGGLGVDVSIPSSRTGSPTRNPLRKVRRKLRDRKEPGWESQSDVDDDRAPPTPIQEPPSPLEKITTRPTDESWKSHRSTNSLGIRRDEQSVGLRGLFKGPRIDTVLRSGVSKLGDIIWKKDENENPSEDDTTEESDVENKGRSRQSLTLSRRESRRLREDAQRPEAKHFFDAMPQFHPVHESSQRSSVAHSKQLSVNDISRPVSRQSSRWEQLKPPRIDVSNASPTISPRQPESEVSDSERSVSEAVKEAGRNLNNAISAPSLEPRPGSQSRHWSITDHTPAPPRAQLSKREIARMRALILSSGIKAMEISRRAHALHKPLSSSSIEDAKNNPRDNVSGVPWADIAQLTSNEKDLHDQQVPACDVYPLASRALGLSIQSSSQTWQSLADDFTSTTAPKLQKRIWSVRSRITDDLSQMTRRAADEADETSKELALDQPLKVKHVVDLIEKLLRNRRRRFRWVRRGLWLAVEWVLVGFMWYVWFMVMIFRIFWGVGRGVVGGVRWLLWL